MIKKTVPVAVVVLLLGAMLLAGGCGSEDGGGGGTSVQVGVEWTRVTDTSGMLLATPGEDVQLTDVCTGGPGLVAVGYSQAAGTSEAGGFPVTLEIWTSPDGRTWSRLGAEAFIDGASREIRKEYQREELGGRGVSGPHIVNGSAGLLVTCGLHIFRSSDGLAWSEVEGIAAFDGSSCEMNTASGRFNYTFAAEYFVDIAGTDQGYVASIRSDTTRAGAQGWLSNPSIWTSTDGEDWQLVQLEYVEMFGMNDVNSLARAGQGMISVGRATDDDYDVNESNAAVWKGSIDGLSWVRQAQGSTSLGGPGAQAMLGVASGGPGMVAVGTEDIDPTGLQYKKYAVAWSSTDGTAWSRTAAGDTALADAEMLDVSVWATGLVAAGVAYQEEIVPNQPVTRYSSGAAWTSADGAAWVKVLLPHLEEEPRSADVALAVTSFAGGLVAVGYKVGTGQQARGAIWTSLSR